MVQAAKTIGAERRARGLTAYHAGASAEEIVARTYEQQGCVVAHRRWRGQAGEVDLIAREGARVVFVEVKKSRDFARAAEMLRPKQMTRLCRAAEEFVAGKPMGQLTEMRFDLALVNGMGAVHIIENAFGDS